MKHFNLNLKRKDFDMINIDDPIYNEFIQIFESNEIFSGTYMECKVTSYLATTEYAEMYKKHKKIQDNDFVLTATIIITPDKVVIPFELLMFNRSSIKTESDEYKEIIISQIKQRAEQLIEAYFQTQLTIKNAACKNTKLH